MKRYTLVVYLALFAVLGCLYAVHAEAGVSNSGHANVGIGPATSISKKGKKRRHRHHRSRPASGPANAAPASPTMNTLDEGVTPAAALGRSSSQEIDDAVETTVGFDEVVYDTDEMWSEAAKDRLTIHTDGLYEVTFTLTSFTSSIQDGYAFIRKNGSTPTAALAGFAKKTVGPVEWLCNASSVEYLVAGDYLQLRVALQTTGGKATILRYAGHSPVMRVARIGGI